MSNQEVLEKAIQKAIDGGWQQDYEGFELLPPDRLGMIKWSYWVDMGNEQIKNEVYSSYSDIIFNHDFTKALWGDSWKQDCKTCGFTHYMYDKDQYDDEQADPYIYHLMQMVIADDPIKYLGENI